MKDPGAPEPVIGKVMADAWEELLDEIHSGEDPYGKDQESDHWELGGEA